MEIYEKLQQAGLTGNEAKETLILDLIKELNKVKTEKYEPVEIKVYEGKEGMRALINIALKEKEMLSFGGTGRAYDLLYEMPAIAKKLEKTAYVLKVLLGNQYAGHEFSKYKNVKVKLVDIKSEATTTIFGEYIS